MALRSRLARPTWSLVPILLAACSGQTPLDTVTAPPDPAAGREVYRRVCAECHGEDGRGRGPRADELGSPTPDLTLLAQRNGGVFPERRLLEVLSGRGGVAGHDTRTMPVWQALVRPPDGSAATAVAAIYQRARLEELTAHLESLQRTDTDAAAP